MIDLFKKGILTGVGLGLMTKEKVEEFVKKTIGEAKLSEEEGKNFLAKVLEQSDDAKKDIEEKINKQIHEIISKLNIPTNEKLTEINNRLENLEKLMNDQK